MTRSVVTLDPATYRRHAVHGDGRIWSETNCYVDVWIELLHALGHEPAAALPFTFAIDFEGDQWTFFKFPLGDLFDLYGLDTQELVVWRPLADHIDEQVSQGRPVLVELDSYFLPDTSGSAYRTTHVKSTVAVMAIDLERATLGYFHGQGYHQLDGQDFASALRVNDDDPSRLPPYVEYVKTQERLDAETTRETSLRLLRRHLRAAPRDNPFDRFQQRFARDLGALLQDDIDRFHQYSFATLRQLGACFELSSTYLRWLSSQDEHELDETADRFQELSESAKRFQFRLARSVAHRSPLDLSPLSQMSDLWACGMRTLRERYQ